MAKRKTLTKKIRFEVFKRDKFTCQYCGKSAPDVILHIDHIVPVAKGGDNDITNLVTSCQGCNSGKKDRSLDDDSVLKKQKNEMDLRQEKINQRKMLIEWRKTLKDDSEQIKKDLNEYFDVVTGHTIKEESNYYKEELEKLIKRFDFETLCNAIDEAYKVYHNADTILNKLGGVAFFVEKEQEQPGYRKAFYIFQYFVKHYNIGYVKNSEKEKLIDSIIFSLDNGITQALHNRLIDSLEMKEYTNFLIGRNLKEIFNNVEYMFNNREIYLKNHDLENMITFVEAIQRGRN